MLCCRLPCPRPQSYLVRIRNTRLELMMSRRQSIVLATVTVVLLIGLGAWLVWPESAVTLENATKIRPGMRLTEVEEILGGPACDDRWGPASGQLEDGTVDWKEWRTLSLRVFVTF